LPGLIVGAEVLHNGKVVGKAGILAPALAREIDASGDVLLAEIEWAGLGSNAATNRRKFSPFAKFPSITRDLALVVDSSLPYTTIADILSASKEPLLAAFAPFDIFQDPSGEKLPADKKSVAVSLTFQSAERTLESSEIDEVVKRLQAALEKQIGAQIRS
jgi:phenylalanyl-tRNA synthetase beta chain